MSPEMVRCPVCQKIGYTDERHEVEGLWPCAKHYLEIMRGSPQQTSLKITLFPKN